MKALFHDVRMKTHASSLSLYLRRIRITKWSTRMIITFFSIIAFSLICLVMLLSGTLQDVEDLHSSAELQKWEASDTNRTHYGEDLYYSQDLRKWEIPDTDILVNDTVSRELAEKIKVLCFITTTPKTIQTKARAVNNTWARRCNKVLFVSTGTDASPDVLILKIEESRVHLTAKTIQSLRYIYDNYVEEYHWFLKADDDSYIVMENLRYLLTHHDHQKPTYMGYHFRMFLEQGYMSGGAGYVMSRKALRMFIEEGINHKNESICRTDGPDEDVDVGRCLEAIGVPPYTTTDRLMKETFHPSGPIGHLTGGLLEYLQRYPKVPIKEGKDCCSQLTISFHYVEPRMMYLIEFLLYRMTVYGWNTHVDFTGIFKKEVSHIEKEEGFDINALY
ncbi:hypothetical protein ScPMuIL_002736 [Solemya velum]